MPGKPFPYAIYLPTQAEELPQILLLFYRLARVSSEYLLNPHVWVSFHDWGKCSYLWCSDYWKMHLSIKYLLYSSGKPNPLPPPPSQLPAQVLTMSPKADGIYSFLFSDYLSPSPCRKCGSRKLR